MQVGSSEGAGRAVSAAGGGRPLWSTRGKKRKKIASGTYSFCDNMTSSKVRRLLVRKWDFGLNISLDQTSLFND